MMNRYETAMPNTSLIRAPAIVKFTMSDAEKIGRKTQNKHSNRNKFIFIKPESSLDGFTVMDG